MAPVRGDHAEGTSCARNQRRRLHGAQTAASILVQVPRSTEKVATLHIGDDDTHVRGESPSAATVGSSIDRSPELRRVGVKSLPG